MDIGAWLRKLGLERYEHAFRENEIDAEILPKLTADDLKDIGVTTVGHRRKLLEAIAALAEPASAPPAKPGAPAEAAPTARPAQAERRQLTVLFCDLVGSTELAARLDPEDMREVIRAYQDACAGAITRFEGHVAKYMGDGVLAYFGWPRAHEDEAASAVRAGLALADAIAELTTPAGAHLAARIGIATGLVVVGDLIGEGSAQEEAVVGDTPNLAARLQALAKPGQVVIAASTRRLLSAAFELTDLGAHELKGIDTPIQAFAVRAERVVESRFDAMGGARLPMVGRDPELALLLERWTQAKAGEGQGVLLVGEAGIGKSRIVRALLDTLADEPHTRVRYQCSPYHTDSALWPVIQQLGHAAGFTPGDPAAARLDKLEALLDQAGHREVAPLIADLLGLDGRDRYGELGITPQAQRARTLEALVAQLLGLAQLQPVLLVLEDAHWVDPTTLELIEQSLDWIAAATVLILLTSRPDRQPELAGHPHVTRLSLARLGRAGVEAIVARLGGPKLSAEAIDAIAARADGVPLFVEELTKAVLETGASTIPASLHDSLMARLDRIPEVKDVVQIAAVIGREFDFALLAAVADQPEADLLAALDRLVAAELIFRRGQPPELRCTFKHALVQGAAYQSLLKSRRRELHARIAATLERQFPEISEAEPELVAHHYTGADLIEPAVRFWQRAGERAVRRSANAEAIEHLMRAIELLKALPDTVARARQELRLQSTLGPALMAIRGQGAPEIGRSYARAIELGPRVGDDRQYFQALWGSWRFHFVRADHPGARALGEQCVTLAEAAGDDAMMLEARFALGGSLMFMGDFPAARTHFEQAVDLYDVDRHRELGFQFGQDPGASCRGYLGFTLWHLGQPVRGIESCRSAVALADTLGHPFTRGQVLMYLAMTLAMARDWPAARACAETTIAHSKEHGFPQTLWLSSSILGRASIEGGDVDAGVTQLEAAITAREATGVSVARLLELALLGDALAIAGRTDDALTAVDRGLAFAERTGEGFYLPELHRLRGELRQRAGAVEAALACFDRGLESARRQQALTLELRLATSRARLRQDLGEPAAARDLVAPVYHRFSEGFETADLKDAKALLDELD